MKCKKCKTELFERDAVNWKPITLNGVEGAAAIPSKYRCPKCFKTVEVKDGI